MSVYKTSFQLWDVLENGDLTAHQRAEQIRTRLLDKIPEEQRDYQFKKVVSGLSSVQNNTELSDLIADELYDWAERYLVFVS